MATAIQHRREVLNKYIKNKKGLMRLFQNCADGKILPSEFYDALPFYWGGDVGGRIQGWGWEPR